MEFPVDHHSAATNNLSVIHTLDTIQITDTTTPQPPAAFYRLSIEPSP